MCLCLVRSLLLVLSVLFIFLINVSLTNTNRVLLTWGSNENGQLGHGDKEKNTVFVPKVVETLRHKHITSVACGARHCIALDSGKRVWSWGLAKSGALGVGVSKPSNIKAQLVFL
jgi:alpha-tubulin suppressor-like RCC1 family protein